MALRLSQLEGTNGFRIDGAMGNGYDEGSVDGAGDVNGDGFDDLIIGSPVAGYYAGQSFVVFGSANGFSARLDLATLDGENGFRLAGGAFDRSGEAAAGAGDVNNDGFDDLVIDGNGESFLVFGSASFEASLAFSELNGENGSVLDGGSESAAEAGDVNGDGIDDLIIGNPFADPRGRDGAGESYVVFGDADGFGETLDLTGLDGTTGFRIMGKRGDASGHSVAGAGDLNGDGINDVIIGGRYARRKAGDSFVVFGSTDGFNARIDLADLDGENGFRLKGVDPGDQSGDYVSGAGDVNGDGFADLIVSAPFANKSDDSDYTTGASYVVFGSASGFRRNVDLAALDGRNGFRVEGFNASYYSGIPVAGAGDVNGDGFGDLIFGDRNANASYVMFGPAGDFAPRYDVAALSGATGIRLEGIAASEVFDVTAAGASVAGAGDVNGDGVDDLFVGAPEAGYVIFGSQQLGGGNDAPSAADDAVRAGTLAVVDLAADNGAGFDRDPDLDDLTIFAIDGTPVTTGSSATLASGLRVTILGGSQVRLDAPDIAVGTVLSDSFVYEISDTRGGSDTATVSVDYTQRKEHQDSIHLAALDGTNGFRVVGIDTDDYSGNSVAGAGDVNGDGFDDVIIGAVGADPGARELAGESYVVFGSEAGPGASLDLAALDGAGGFRLDGSDAGSFNLGSRSGNSVAGAGDVNGDGLDDLITGAWGFNPEGRYEAGASYVVFGSLAGFGESLELSALDGANGFRLDGHQNGGRSGSSVAGAGDINGDGVNDLIIGAPLASPGGRKYAGVSHVVFGSASGFDASLDLAALDERNGFRLNGDDRYDWSGSSVTGAGDINGDGIDDLIVGAPSNGGYGGYGQSYVVFGTSSGVVPSINLAALDGADGFQMEGIEEYDRSGSSVAGAGDVNGDGIDDLIIGSGRGACYVVFGSSASFGARFDLRTLDGENGFRIAVRSGWTGASVAGAGDVNGDGLNDLIVGLAGGGLGEYGYSNVGESYVIFGSVSGFGETLRLTELGARGFRVDGIDIGDGSGVSVDGAGDVNGDGLDDLIIGASGANSAAGETYVVFGVRTGSPPIEGGPNGDDLQGGADVDLIFGRAGNDVLAGLAGDDLLAGGDGRDVLFGGVANDRLRGGDARDGLNGGDGSDRLSGGSGHDRLLGEVGADLLEGDTGRDLLRGGNGGDQLNGGDGGDRLNGGNGRDWLAGAAGDDLMIGGAGRDLLEGGVGWDVLRGGAAADRLRGNSGVDRLNGGDGLDRLAGGASDDRLIGGAGGDSLNGGLGWDVLRGGGAQDWLFGRNGNDRLIGGGGRDKLIGGKDSDVLFGNAGVDVFIFTREFGSDRIGDFDADPRGIQDRIDLRRLRVSQDNFEEKVVIGDLGSQTRIDIDGQGTILCEGVAGQGRLIISEEDFLLLA